MNALAQALAAILLLTFGLALGAALGVATGHPGPFRPWLEQHDLLPLVSDAPRLPHHRTSDYSGDWQ